MSKVYVIMANDFPIGIFDNLDVVQTMCDRLNKLDAISRLKRINPHLNNLPKKPRFGLRIWNPHFGHLSATSLTSAAHSGQLIRLIAILLFAQ